MPLLIIGNNGKKEIKHETKPGQWLTSIGDFGRCKFEIPAYQRGFRWTTQQIKELIDDLYEFSTSDNKKRYCLQNITVRMKQSNQDEPVYEVIDGQQRLTAIWILIMACLDSSQGEELLEYMPEYCLTYEGKNKLTDYVNQINQRVRENPSEKNITSIEAPKDIDSAYIFDAFKYIVNDYSYATNNKPTKYSFVLSNIFSEAFARSKKDIVVIWNEIEIPGNVNESNKTKYIIERFSNLNANKIPLTESELIKAYFIDTLLKENGSTNMQNGKVPEFSLQWEAIERGLNDENFWYFITSGEYFETRFDLLFQIYLGCDESVDKNGQHNLSRLISLEFQCKTPSSVWKDIVQIYDTLQDWYKDYYYYHVIGLIIAIEKQRKATRIIRELYDIYDKNPKDKFAEELRKRLRGESFYSIPFSNMEGDWRDGQPDKIILDGEDDSLISYKKNKDCIKPILLLFNISLLVNAYQKNKENAAERFPFKIYKSQDNPIEIEHINPQALDRIDINNVDDIKERKEWAKETIKIIEDDKRKKIENELETAKWQIDDKMIEEIEREAKLDTLSNLTLLDKNLNGSYGNENFANKRNYILAARFGNYILKNDERKDYKQSVIFPGTMWVFMRQYNDVKGSNTERWNSHDRQEYIRAMQNSIFNFLKPCADEEGEQ